MERRRLSLYRASALAGMVGPILFGLANAGIAVTSDLGYSPVSQSISDLALTPLGWLQSAALYLFGVLLIAFIVGLYTAIGEKTLALKAGVGAFILIGVGLQFVGAFQMDVAGATLHGRIHTGAILSIAFLFPLSCFLLAPSLKADHAWRGLYVYTLINGVMILPPMISVASLPGANWIRFGLYEGIFIASGLVWVEVMAIRLLTLSRAPHRQRVLEELAGAALLRRRN